MDGLIFYIVVVSVAINLIAGLFSGRDESAGRDSAPKGDRDGASSKERHESGFCNCPLALMSTDDIWCVGCGEPRLPGSNSDQITELMVMGDL